MTNINHRTNEIRELSANELEAVSGGDPMDYVRVAAAAGAEVGAVAAVSAATLVVCPFAQTVAVGYMIGDLLSRRGGGGR
jgi:hypothetical protein